MSWLNKKTTQASQGAWPVLTRGGLCLLDSFCDFKSHKTFPFLDCESRPGGSCSTAVFSQEALTCLVLEAMAELNEVALACQAACGPAPMSWPRRHKVKSSVLY